jgi:hypothetical protein
MECYSPFKEYLNLCSIFTETDEGGLKTGENTDQRRRLKCEKLTDDEHQVMAKLTLPLAR